MHLRCKGARKKEARDGDALRNSRVQRWICMHWYTFSVEHAAPHYVHQFSPSDNLFESAQRCRKNANHSICIFFPWALIVKISGLLIKKKVLLSFTLYLKKNLKRKKLFFLHLRWVKQYGPGFYLQYTFLTSFVLAPHTSTPPHRYILSLHLIHRLCTFGALSSRTFLRCTIKKVCFTSFFFFFYIDWIARVTCFFIPQVYNLWFSFFALHRRCKEGAQTFVIHLN